MALVQKKQKTARQSCRGEEYLDDDDDDDNDFVEDRLSELPDEILIPILSLLTLREAVSTSILSQRWRFLWTFISTLNFDPVANKIETKSCFFNPSTVKSRRKYVKWVDNVLALYKGDGNLEEFGVCFDLAKTSPSHVNNWFEYAMSKNVKHLEFNFLKCPLGNPYSDLTNLSRFHFFRILGSRKSCDPFMKPNGTFVGFHSLKSLSLKFINVSCEAIEYFLYNCPLLERLSVHGSSRLYNLRIISPSIKLRHLEIVRCFNIQTIEIRDTNLVSFTHSRDSGFRSTTERPNRIVVKNSPLLVEVLVGAGSLTFAQHMLLKLSCFIHQLQILELTLYHHQPERKMSYYMLPILRNLKQLKLIVFLGGIEHCLLGFVAMLKNFPSLETFVLQLERRNEVTPLEAGSPKKLSPSSSIRYPHEFLKVVKMIGFNDFSADCDFLMQMIENAIALKKIIIDTSEGHKMGGNWLKRAIVGRKRAEQLKYLVPPNLEFIIL